MCVLAGWKVKNAGYKFRLQTKLAASFGHPRLYLCLVAPRMGFVGCLALGHFPFVHGAIALPLSQDLLLESNARVPRKQSI